MAEALIALGGNVGDARAALAQAIELLCRDGTVMLRARSSDYRTPPWGEVNQPAFVNACILVSTELPARALLDRAHMVEEALGRNRAQERHWGPRRIDIDLLTYNDQILNERDLILPHPHLFERAFVLVPLAEIAPDHVIAGVRVDDALARVDAHGIERLPPPETERQAD